MEQTGSVDTTITGEQIITGIQELSAYLNYPLAGIDWDLENRINGTDVINWAAKVSKTLHLVDI